MFPIPAPNGNFRGQPTEFISVVKTSPDQHCYHNNEHLGIPAGKAGYRPYNVTNTVGLPILGYRLYPNLFYTTRRV